jgi:hypothetical protein
MKDLNRHELLGGDAARDAAIRRHHVERQLREERHRAYRLWLR